MDEKKFGYHLDALYEYIVEVKALEQVPVYDD